MPAREQWIRVLLMLDHNTRVVTMGTMTLGLVAGLVGVFALLRKRSLVGDVVGHASLPGIALAFIAMEILTPGKSRSLVGLLLGATVSGSLGAWATILIRRGTRIKEDAALSIVLSVSFGLAMVLFTIIQSLPAGNAAGLNRFIFGSAASLLEADAWFILQAAAIVLVICVLLFKELALLCFDEPFAASQGWPTYALDLALMAMIVAVAEIGAQSVGLILVSAMIIIPAAAARFWSHRLSVMAIVAAAVGALSAYLGVAVSALAPRLAAGAVIILMAGMAFFISLFLGPSRGAFWNYVRQRQLRRKVGRYDLLRAFYELLESQCPPRTAPWETPLDQPIRFAELWKMRSWSSARLRSLLATAAREGLIAVLPDDRCQLTRTGQAAARQAVRNHRLWELYLIHHAAISPLHVDRIADEIEHVLAAPLVAELERLLEQERQPTVPASPHDVGQLA